jgi:predicted CoA-binding protein
MSMTRRHAASAGPSAAATIVASDGSSPSARSRGEGVVWHATSAAQITTLPYEDTLSLYQIGAKVDGMATINDARLREILTGSPTVAVLGVHKQPEKAAFYVPEYLHDEGYRVIGVNPEFCSETLFGEKVRATLSEIGEPVDLVDVFRRPELIPTHIEDILAMTPRPKVVWFQLGIKNDEAAKVLEDAGIVVIQNRCTLADHQRLGLGAPVKK